MIDSNVRNNYAISYIEREIKRFVLYFSSYLKALFYLFGFILFILEANIVSRAITLYSIVKFFHTQTHIYIIVIVY